MPFPPPIKESKMSTSAAKPTQAVLLGLPNSGKSTLFTRLTGRYVAVANAPLTTLELERAPLLVTDDPYEIVDAPGFTDLFASLSRGEAVREALAAPGQIIAILCLDANRFKQSLSLLLEVQTLGLPMVVALNMVEEANNRGLTIDAPGLADRLGVPVVEQRGGADDVSLLAQALPQARPARPEGLDHGAALGAALEIVAASLPVDCPYPGAAARHVLLGGAVADFFPAGPAPSDNSPALAAAAAARALPGDALSLLTNGANQWIDATCRLLVQQRSRHNRDILQLVARMSRSLVFGPPILISILYVTFILVVDGANAIAELLNARVWNPVHAYLSGVLPQGFWTDFLIGEYGLLSMGLANALLTVLPILSVFYLVFNTLEDMGYLPNLSVLTRRILGRLGLGGSAIMPLVLGFGCKTMATLTARTIASKRERFITIFLIAFAIPCAGQMGLNMSIIGRMGLSAFFISSLALVVVELAAGYLLNRFLSHTEEAEGFILELPPIRIPQPKAVLRKTVHRLYLFLDESLGVFILAALSLFTLDRLGILQGLKTVLGPVLEKFLGLPASMLDAVILLLARHEAAAALIIELIRKGQLDYRQSIIAVTLTTMFIPCFANVMAMTKVLGARSSMTIFFAVNLAALASCSVLNLLLQWYGQA